MLVGAPFEFLVNLTDMQEHERLNRQALEAGRHVWSEKPIASTLGEGQRLLRLAADKAVRLWGAPITVQSPQLAFMAHTVRPAGSDASLLRTATTAMKVRTGRPSSTSGTAAACPTWPLQPDEP